jgi:hypothetical protein
VWADSESKVCVACGVEAPETRTDYTLIGSKHAWRLDRRRGTDGAFQLVWYCPDCWKGKRVQSANSGKAVR